MSCIPLQGNPGLAAGWGCCACRTYNGLQRSACKACDHRRCDEAAYPEPMDAEAYARALGEMEALEAQFQAGAEYPLAEGIAAVQRFMLLVDLVKSYEDANFPPADGERTLH